MNLLGAVVSNIRGLKSLHIIEFDYHGETLCMMGLELPNIQIGSKVILSVKPTLVSFAKDFQENISFSNKIKAKIVNIDNGELLSSVVMDTGYDKIEAVLMSKISKKMDLKIEDEIIILIKESELFIKEVL